FGATHSRSDFLEEMFDHVARVAGSFIEAAAVLIVTFGSLEAFVKLVPVMLKPKASHGQRKAIWRRYGTWLLLGLEFELAADIVGSVISPTGKDIGGPG